LTCIKAAGARLGYKQRVPPSLIADLGSPPAVPMARVERARVAPGMAAARGWFLFAIGSLVLAGLLSLTLVVGRLPFLSGLFTDPLFFKRALVVHVDLAIVVWFQAGTLTLLGWALGPHLHRGVTRVAQALAAAGVVGLLLGAVMPGAQPVLSNYVPVIDHPIFFAGLVCWFAGGSIFFLTALFTPARTDVQALNPGTVMALRAAAAANVLGALTFVGAWLTTPKAEPLPYAELVFWGGGHVLQAANVATMLALWLHLQHRLTGRAALTRGMAGALMLALVLPQTIMPWLAFKGTTETAYFSMATHLMRWTMFPVVLVFGGALGAQLWRQKAEFKRSDYRFTGLAGSAVLTLMGFGLGALIRGSTTLVPGHYHCAIGAVTIALMAVAYEFCTAGSPAGGSPVPVRRARWQLLLFGSGQAVFGLGFALAGAYGMGRKQYGVEQHVRTLGEYLGLTVMGLGGLVAVVGGVFFLTVMVRRISAWWSQFPPIPETP